MARLKIPTKTSGVIDHDAPDEQGYVNLVENLVEKPENYFAFLLADEDERPGMLKKYVAAKKNGDPYDASVYQEQKEWTNVRDKYVEITDDNCLIKVGYDKRKKFNGRKPARYLISFPEERPPDVSYLDTYAKIVHDLYDSDKARCYKFMFGMMLITRCR